MTSATHDPDQRTCGFTAVLVRKLEGEWETCSSRSEEGCRAGESRARMVYLHSLPYQHIVMGFGGPAPALWVDGRGRSSQQRCGS